MQLKHGLASKEIGFRFSFLQHISTEPEAHLTGIEDPSVDMKLPGCGLEHPRLGNTEIKNMWGLASIPVTHLNGPS